MSKRGDNMSLLIEQALDSITFNINKGKKDTEYTHDGIPVPRVTEVISKMIHKDSLMYWANSLGFKGLKYSTVLNSAARLGTAAHYAIEMYLKNKLEDSTNIPFLGFLSWYNTITQEIKLPIEVIMVEQRLTCKWFGGTMDALLKIGNKIYLVDFKTSNHITSNYFFQLAAYRFMLKLQKRIEIDGVIVLQLDKDSPGFNEYLLDFEKPDHAIFMNHCEVTFLSLVYAYYNVEYAERTYKSLFK